MTDKEFQKGLTSDQAHYWENACSQRDEALARIADYDANAAKVQSDHTKALQEAKDAADKAAADLTAQLAEMQEYVQACGGTKVAQELTRRAAMVKLDKEAQEADALAAQKRAERAALEE